jgi:plastocyanin
MGGGGTGGGNTTTTGGTTGGNTVAVQMVNMTFTPQVTNAHAGDTIQWTNSSGLVHTVNSDTNQAGLDSSTAFPSGIGAGSVFTWTVPANATIGTNFFYHCAFHGAAGNGTALGVGMSGEITVN